MKSTLADAMESGLVVTFSIDDQKQHQVFLKWDSRFVPLPGDIVSCIEEDVEGNVTRRLSGTVVGPRRMEVHRRPDGRVSLWVRVQAKDCSVEVSSRKLAAEIARALHGNGNGKARLVASGDRFGR